MFPNGFAGAGLLLLRAICGIFILGRSSMGMLAAPSTPALVLHTIAIGAALLLLAGLWTPIAGLVILFTEPLLAFALIIRVESSVLLAAFGAAIALLGPGAYSVDAMRYGRKRIRIPND